jgi:hypothetical protein
MIENGLVGILSLRVNIWPLFIGVRSEISPITIRPDG